MEHYSRMLIQFVHAMGRRHRRFEAFLFSTRLTRVTKQVRRRHLDEAVAAVTRSVPDWSGGTRIGDALRIFYQRWSRVVLHRGPVVLIISDGWETGDPALLAREMARLSRLAYRIVWVNPRVADPRYRPLAGGMAVAWPYCDAVVSAHRLTALGELVAALAGPDRPR